MPQELLLFWQFCQNLMNLIYQKWMPNRLHFFSCLFWCTETWEPSQKVGCVISEDLSAPGSIMKQGTESVLAFCLVIHYITNFDLGVMKLEIGFGPHTVIQFSKLYWNQPSPVKCILSILWDNNFAITMEFQSSRSWGKQHGWRIHFVVNKEKMQMPRATLTGNNQSSTWNYTTNARLFSLFQENFFHNSGFFFTFQNYNSLHFSSPQNCQLHFSFLIQVVYDSFPYCCILYYNCYFHYLVH